MNTDITNPWEHVVPELDNTKGNEDTFLVANSYSCIRGFRDYKTATWAIKCLAEAFDDGVARKQSVIQKALGIKD